MFFSLYHQHYIWLLTQSASRPLHINLETNAVQYNFLPWRTCSIASLSNATDTSHMWPVSLENSKSHMRLVVSTLATTALDSLFSYSRQREPSVFSPHLPSLFTGRAQQTWRDRELTGSWHHLSPDPLQERRETSKLTAALGGKCL